MIDTTYILQSSEHRYGRWTPWSCCSPQYGTMDEARKQYDSMKSCYYLHTCVRLVKVSTRWEQVPGVRCCYNAGFRIRVYGVKRLRCYRAFQSASQHPAITKRQGELIQ